VVSWLSSLHAWGLVLGWLGLALLVVAVGRVGVRALVPATEREHVHQIAPPLMPALGAAFAIFAALTLASEAGYLRSAESLVSDEAAASSRLAWAATSPKVDSAPIQTALHDYLRTTRSREWDGAVAARGDDTATAAALAHLERVVRAEAARPELGTPASTELLASLDAVTSSRRARLAAASREIPALYIVTLVAAGLALVFNAGALTFRSSLRTSVLALGLAGVVGLSLALLFSITAPWRGPMIVDGHPIDEVVQDLADGFFSA
jgi:phosphoribosylcarboxyaminoimidazole (NCAIR) mutase